MRFTSLRHATRWMIVSVMILLVTVLHSACSQAQNTPTGSQPPFGQANFNDPSLVRPSGYSVQNGSQNNQQQIVVQPTGQRIFQQNANQPANQNQVAAPERLNDASSVQPASWSSTASATNVSATNASGTDLGKNRKSPLELKSRSKDKSNTVDKPTSSWAAGLSMFFSLAIVLSLFFLIAWLFRKSQPNAFVRLPIGVVQVMGRTAMAPRQQVYVVRFGGKLLLISHQPGQTQTLCEITDPDEVQRLAGMCEANQPNSITHSFRDVLKQVASGKPESSRKSAVRLT